MNKIKACFTQDRVFYSQHAKDEMRREELGVIKEQEVYEAVLNGEVIESYLDDEPYPSFLIYGKTQNDRPLHTVCAYVEEDHLVVVITVYQPDPGKWKNYRSRR